MKTVKELIEELSKLDPNSSIWIEDLEEMDTGIGSMNTWILFPPIIYIEHPSKNESCYVLCADRK